MRIALGIAASACICSAAAAQMYGVAIVGQNRLFIIDRDNAKTTLVGRVGDATPLNGLAYDPKFDILYAVVPGAGGGLYTVNRTSGQATLVGPLGGPYTNVNGLALDPGTGTLYATDNTTNSLLRLNLNTGAATLIAKITGGFTEIEGLGFDPANQILYGITQIQKRLVTINVINGVAVGVGPQLPSGTWRGLEYDPHRKTLFATSSAQLYKINPSTGAATFVGTMPAGIIQGLAIVPDPCYADCDKTGTLDIDDFICFQEQLAMGDMSADCDKNGELDIDDFICFQTAFGIGCP